jgi:CheY-like chemotaxis protein
MRLSCRDTGVGISQPDIQKLFQPFQQIKARELQNGGGTGLGLSICKHVMEAQGGFAGCHSEDAKGSEFFFEVLVYEYTDALAMDALHEWSTSKLQRSCSDQEVYCESPRTRTLSQSFSQSCTPDESVELESTTVLLVDDDRMVQKLIKRALQRMNVSVVQAYTGDEAVAAAEAHRSAIRLVLMDNHMPSMQGPEATRKLKISCPEMYVVGLTGSSEDSDIQEFLTAGAQEVLVKPIDMNRLQQIVGMHA